MKKQLTKAISKKVFTFLFVVVISCTMSQSVYALPDTLAISKGAEITYKGLSDKNLVFSVNYKNELAEPFELLIKNDQNEIIYVKQFDAKPLNRTLLFSEVPENCKLTFVITSGKKAISQSFEINAHIRTVEEFIVKGI